LRSSTAVAIPFTMYILLLRTVHSLLDNGLVGDFFNDLDYAEGVGCSTG